MIKQTIFTASQDLSKPALTGLLTKVHEGLLEIVAIDGFRIAYRAQKGEYMCSVQGTQDAPKTHLHRVSAIIPAKTMGEIAKLAGNEDITLHMADGKVLFQMENCIAVSRLLEGNFIDYEKLLAVESIVTVKLNRKELLEAVGRACLISDENNKRLPVKLDISNGVIKISSKGSMDSMNEEIAVVTEGGNLAVGFNPRYIIEALKAIESDEITITFGGALKPCVITPAEGDESKHLVLPLRLQS